MDRPYGFLHEDESEPKYDGTKGIDMHETWIMNDAGNNYFDMRRLAVMALLIVRDRREEEC